MSQQVPALEGGSAVRSGGAVPFFRTELTEADLQAVQDTLRSGWLTLGPRVAQFEQACAERLGASQAVATNSCTSSLFLALECLGLGAGQEVIVPSMTFASSVHTIRNVGATPVLADIEPVTMTLAPEAVEALLTPATGAILCVDYAGHPSRLPELRRIAESHDLVLIEDAAHSFGAALQDRPVGAWADATAFSFYATKCITTGEGGLLTFRDDVVAERARLLGYHGMHRDAWKRYTDRGSWYYEVAAVGHKFNMTDVQAALGLSQLQREPQLRAARQAVVARYQQAFADLDAVECPQVLPEAEHAWHLYVIRLHLEQLRCDRDRFSQALREEGVVPSVHFIPYHKHPAARDLPLRRPLPVTEDMAARCLSLPLFPTMRDDEIEDVIAAVRKLVLYYRR
jgi:dTDP-4-amino-4,6-dideoxygalactose transaminase